MSSGDGGSTFVGLVINGFDERLVGATAKATLESLSALLSSASAARKRYAQEHMDETLAEQYTLIGQRLSARLPGDFQEAAYSEPVVGAGQEPTAAEPKSSSGSTKKARAVAAAKAASAVDVDQQMTWKHHLIPVTSQGVKRSLHVYSLEPMAG